MSLFPTTKRVTVSESGGEGSNLRQGVTLLVRQDLSVEQAIAYQKRTEQNEDDNFEKSIALLLAYVEGWEVDGVESSVPWSEETLRKLRIGLFEALVVAVADEIAPEADEAGDESPNA